jgi:hypothetical protein
MIMSPCLMNGDSIVLYPSVISMWPHSLAWGWNIPAMPMVGWTIHIEFFGPSLDKDKCSIFIDKFAIEYYFLL